MTGGRPGAPRADGLRRFGPGALLICLVLVLWETGCRLLAVDPIVLPAPSRILTALWDARAAAADHALATLVETALGFSVSVVFAIGAALAMDHVGWIRRAVYPILVASQTIPIVAVAPLFVLWFGIGLLPKILIVVLVTFFPVTVAMLDGLASADPSATDLLISFGASERQILVKVRWPGALPSLFTGLRIAVTYAVIGAVFAEWTGATKGLGIWLLLSKNLFRTDLVFGAILVTAAMTLVLWGLVNLAERVTIPWYAEARSAR